MLNRHPMLLLGFYHFEPFVENSAIDFLTA